MKAVFAPGLDTDYFDGLTLAATPPQLTSAFAQANAWWLAELSRVIYRRSTGEDGMVLPDRRTVLANAGLTETLFVSKGPTQAGIISAGAFHALVFRGTEDLQDWLRNAETLLVSWDGPGKVHKGFLRALDEVWTTIHPVLQKIEGPIFYTGHSLGAAIAVLAAARIEAARRPLAVYTFGSPRCGNKVFAKQHPLRDRTYRVVNNRDIVPLMPPLAEHLGELHYITSDKRFVTNPKMGEMFLDRLKDDDTHELLRDGVPELITDHAPANYVAWMQRFAR
jgi:triacylglycerol lipase